MACPICGANCRCRKRGPNGECCGCHKHKAQRAMSRDQVNAWRADHLMDPITNAQWRTQYDPPERPKQQDLFE